MAVRQITIPGQNVPIQIGNTINPDWYDKLKFLELLNPLSDQDFTAIEAEIALKSDTLRNYNTQTGTTYSLQTSDSGKVVLFTNSSAVTFTIPALGVAPTATQIMQVDIIQYGAGKVTLSPAVGVSLVSKAGYKSTGGQYSASTLLNVGTDAYLYFGDIVA